MFIKIIFLRTPQYLFKKKVQTNSSQTMLTVPNIYIFVRIYSYLKVWTISKNQKLKLRDQNWFDEIYAFIVSVWKTISILLGSLLCFAVDIFPLRIWAEFDYQRIKTTGWNKTTFLKFFFWNCFLFQICFQYFSKS